MSSSVLSVLGEFLWTPSPRFQYHYDDVIMGTIASLITSLMIVYSTVYSDANQRKHQSSTSLAFVRGIHRGPVNSPHKWPVTRKFFPFDDVIMYRQSFPLKNFNYEGKVVANIHIIIMEMYTVLRRYHPNATAFIGPWAFLSYVDCITWERLCPAGEVM